MIHDGRPIALRGGFGGWICDDCCPDHSPIAGLGAAGVEQWLFDIPQYAETSDNGSIGDSSPAGLSAVPWDGYIGRSLRFMACRCRTNPTLEHMV